MEKELLKVAFNTANINGCELEDLQQASGLSGHAKFDMKSGCSYEGQIKDGKLHGTGRLTFPDNMVYEGTFHQNDITGHGVYRWPCGTSYEGDVLRGKRHGHGRMRFSDSPAVYEGQWQHGMRHGQGTLTLDAEGKHWYKGDWHADMKSGNGTMHYANGNQYDGEWSQDVKCGYGIMEWKTLRQRYEGLWARNKPNGMGNHVWYQQLVTEPSKSNHALLVMFNRYRGQFYEGERSGYGVLYYATGARYEGCWAKDKKEGEGCYVFENGEAWQGLFSEDRPILTDREVFGPLDPSVSIQVHDLFDEEEVPAAAARGVYNLLMVYNTDLRALYDKYCSRPSLHFMKHLARPSFTLVTCQVWELLSDVRMLSAATPIARCNEMFLMARRPPEKLKAFRKRMHAMLRQPSDEYDSRFWEELLNEHKQGGVHNPMAEMLFYQFCEALVRLAALRYRHLPGLEKRLHTLIHVHLIHQVSKSKATLPPPPRLPYHMEMWAGNAMAVLQAQQELLHAVWGVLAESVAATDGTVVRQPVRQLARHITCEQQQLIELENIYGPVYRVRDFMALLQNLSLLPTPQLAMQAAAALTSNYLTMNTYEFEETSQKLRIEEFQETGPGPQGTTRNSAGAASTEAEVGVPHEGGAGSKGESMNGGSGAGGAAAAGPGTSLGAEGTAQRKDKIVEERQQGRGGAAGSKAESADGGRGSASSNSDSSKAGSEAGKRAGREAQMDQPLNTAHQELTDADVREVLCWLDAPLTYPDFLEGVGRVANALLAWQHDNLKDRLNKFLTGADGLKVALKVKSLKRDPQHKEAHREP
mmetsp:Transcript_1547/g.3780  ORF Transcript_1547/g.3780 Transcript_1547/m.3780 type:complete len:812 (+) Transcript_1547:196-2631(+)